MRRSRRCRPALNHEGKLNLQPKSISGRSKYLQDLDIHTDLCYSSKLPHHSDPSVHFTIRQARKAERIKKRRESLSLTSYYHYYYLLHTAFHILVFVNKTKQAKKRRVSRPESSCRRYPEKDSAEKKTLAEPRLVPKRPRIRRRVFSSQLQRQSRQYDPRIRRPSMTYREKEIAGVGRAVVDERFPPARRFALQVSSSAALFRL